MKNRIARIACVALIIAGVFFTTGRAEAKIFVRASNTGCMAPADGNAVGVCSQPGEKAAVGTPPAPKHWHSHRHWRWQFRHHFHFHHSYHHSGSHFHHHH